MLWRYANFQRVPCHTNCRMAASFILIPVTYRFSTSLPLTRLWFPFDFDDEFNDLIYFIWNVCLRLKPKQSASIHPHTFCHFEPELEAIGTCCLLFVRNVNQRKSNWLTCPLQFPETWARASCWGWIQGRSVSCCCHPIKSLKQSHHHLYRRARLVQLQLRVYINTNTIKTASQRASSLGTQVRTLSCTRWPANMRIGIVW